ncbi:MAG: 50S ribosomal protein L30e [Candidatus Micrarchaeia archaeon]
MDLQKAIRIAVETGKTNMGARQARTLALKGGAALLIISSNCPKQIMEEIIHYAEKSKTPYYKANFTSMEIGSICGKPFPVSILSIIEPGNSDILRIIEKGTVAETETGTRETLASMKKRSRESKKTAKGEKGGPAAEQIERKESERSDTAEEIEGESAEAKQ